MTVGNGAAEEVDSFKYLGANVTTDGGSTADINVMFNGRYILQEAREYLGGMSIGINTIVSLFKSLMLSVLFYLCET